jgi:hypothetical protein
MQHSEFSTLLGSGRVFDEGETFGEFMAEIQGQEIADRRHFRRLERVLTLLEQRAARIQGRAGFVLERFHLSYYALLPDWDLYSGFDERLARLKCLIVLLHIPEQDLERRCLDREDRAGTTWSDDMIRHFGSRAAVLDAVAQSVRRRREATRKSRSSILEIDTGSRSWNAYADQIVDAWRALM